MANKGIKSLWGYPLIDEKGRNAIDSVRSNLENNFQKKTDDTLGTTDKTVPGAINEIKNNIDTIGDNFTSEKTETKYDMKYNGKSIGSINIELEEDQIAGGDGSFNIDLTPYQTKNDDTLTTTNKTIIGGINEIKNDIIGNKDTLTTTNKTNIVSSINEVNAQCKDIENKTITTEERTKLTSLNNYDDSDIKTNIQSVQQQVNNLVLGAVGDGNNAEVVQARGNYSILNDRLNAYDGIIKDSNVNALEKMNVASLEIFNKSSYMEKITPTINNNVCVKLDGTMNPTTPEYKSLEFDVQNKNYIYVKNFNVVKASDDYCLYCIIDSTNGVLNVVTGENQTLNELIFIPANGAKIRFTCATSTYANGEVFSYTNIKDVIDDKSSYEYVNNTVDKVDKIYEVDNLYDKNSTEIMKGHFLSGAGDITERADKFVTNFMPVTENDTIYGNFMAPTYFVCYDADKTMLGADYIDTRPEGISLGNLSSISKDKLSTLAYIRFSNDLPYIDSMTITKTPTYRAREHKVLPIKNLKETNNGMINFWEGKIGDSLGDSLTEQGFFQRYTSMYFNLKSFSNHGVGGSKLSGADIDSSRPSMWQDSRINALKSDANFITILGGQNDGDVEIGTISKTNMDTNTYVGALNTIIDKVYTKYNGNIKIILCTPFYVPSEGDDGERFIKLDKAVIEIGRLHGLPVADFGGNCGANKYTKDLYWGTTDKTHPIEDFYRDRITPILIDTMKKIEPIDYTKCNSLTYQISQ